MNIINRLQDLILSKTAKIPYLQKVLSRNRSLIIYGLIGFSGMGIDFIVFAFLIKIMDVYYIIANIISVSCGITNNFFWNRFINFKVYDSILQRFISFYTIGIAGMVLSTISVKIAVDFYELNVLVSKLIIAVIVVIIQFILNKTFSFGKIFSKKVNN